MSASLPLHTLHATYHPPILPVVPAPLPPPPGAVLCCAALQSPPEFSELSRSDLHAALRDNMPAAAAAALERLLLAPCRQWLDTLEGAKVGQGGGGEERGDGQGAGGLGCRWGHATLPPTEPKLQHSSVRSFTR